MLDRDVRAFIDGPSIGLENVCSVGEVGDVCVDENFLQLIVKPDTPKLVPEPQESTILALRKRQGFVMLWKPLFTCCYLGIEWWEVVLRCSPDVKPPEHENDGERHQDFRDSSAPEYAPPKTIQSNRVMKEGRRPTTRAA